MQTTEAELEDDDKKDDDVVRSLRFKKPQWDALKQHIAKHGIKMAAFLRNAALRAAGYQTEVDGMRNTATALARAVDSVVEPAEPAPPVPPARPARPKKSSKSKRR